MSDVKRQEAIAYFQRKIDENPMDGDAHHNLAVLYKSRGDLDLYARHSRIALLTEQGGPKVWNEMALTLLQQGKIDDAHVKLEEVIMYWPTFPYSYVNMAALLAKTGKYVEALPFCIQALRLIPNDPAAHHNIAKVYESLGRTSEALTHYQRALALVPNDATLAKRIALLSLSKGQTQSSMEHYHHYRSLRGEHYDLKL